VGPAAAQTKDPPRASATIFRAYLPKEMSFSRGRYAPPHGRARLESGTSEKMKLIEGKGAVGLASALLRNEAPDDK